MIWYIWCVLVYILIRLCLKNSLKINMFLYKTFLCIKYNYYIGACTLAMGYLAPGEIFENMLQLKL